MTKAVVIDRHSPWHEPTHPQRRAGNYAKRRIRWNGLELAIENEPGSVRTFLKPDGTVGERRMIYPYGYVCRSTGADGDEVDCFVGPDLDTATDVFIVDVSVKGNWSKLDEQKAMLGFSSPDDAKRAFFLSYDDPRLFMSMKSVPIREFAQKVRATKSGPRLIKSIVIIRRGSIHF